MTIGGREETSSNSPKSQKKRNGFNVTMTSIIDQARATEQQIMQRIKNKQREDGVKSKNGHKMRLIAAAVDKT